jgi:hypothetical protein
MTDMPKRIWARRLTETDTRWQETPYSADNDHGMTRSLAKNIKGAEYVRADIARSPDPILERMAEALREIAPVLDRLARERFDTGIQTTDVAELHGNARAVIAEYEQMKGE